MFTVMHEKMDGTQELFSSMRIQYIPRTEETAGIDGVHLLCGPGEEGPGIRCGRITDGRVFVMNREGCTVGRFYLDKPSAKPIAS